jgi:hypothetical protein
MGFPGLLLSLPGDHGAGAHMTQDFYTWERATDSSVGSPLCFQELEGAGARKSGLPEALRTGSQRTSDLASCLLYDLD